MIVLNNPVQLFISLLKELERLIPPPENCHHSVTYAQYGSDETGWKDKLGIQVNIGGKFVCVFLDDTDIDCTANELAQKIALEARGALDDPGTQFSIAAGQYIS